MTRYTSHFSYTFVGVEGCYRFQALQKWNINVQLTIFDRVKDLIAIMVPWFVNKQQCNQFGGFKFETLFIFTIPGDAGFDVMALGLGNESPSSSMVFQWLMLLLVLLVPVQLVETNSGLQVAPPW